MQQSAHDQAKIELIGLLAEILVEQYFEQQAAAQQPPQLATQENSEHNLAA